VAGVAVERELRDGEHHPADVGERPLHLAALLEDAETGDLRGEALAVLRSVVRADAQEDNDTGFDLGHALITDVDGGRANALNDRARLVHSNIHGLSPRTTASTSEAERWPGVKTVMLLPSGRRVM
jgi:hypothetical protein